MAQTKRKTRSQKGSSTPAAVPPDGDTFRERLLAQVTRLERECPGWNAGLVRDLFDVNEFVVGFEILADQLLEHNPPHCPAFFALLALAKERGVGELTLGTLEKLAARFAVLSLASGQRGGGRGQSHRDYRELVIDGIALTKRIGRDYIPVFGWLGPSVQLSTVVQLSKSRAGEWPGGRVALCVCPECGDLSCGAVGISVEVTANAVVWRDFGMINDYEEGFTYLDIGPFRFEPEAYRTVLSELRGAVGAAHSRGPSAGPDARSSLGAVRTTGPVIGSRSRF